MSASSIGNGQKATETEPDKQAGATSANGNGLQGVELSSAVASNNAAAVSGAGGQTNGATTVSPFANRGGPAIRAEGAADARYWKAEEGVPQQQAQQQQKAFISPPQRMVSWQDEVNGQDLFSVREFEPSEGGQEQDADQNWDHERKACCCIM